MVIFAGSGPNVLGLLSALSHCTLSLSSHCFHSLPFLYLCTPFSLHHLSPFSLHCHPLNSHFTFSLLFSCTFWIHFSIDSIFSPSSLYFLARLSLSNFSFHFLSIHPLSTFWIHFLYWFSHYLSLHVLILLFLNFLSPSHSLSPFSLISCSLLSHVTFSLHFHTLVSLSLMLSLHSPPFNSVLVSLEGSNWYT